jgi:hypothetical protein
MGSERLSYFLKPTRGYLDRNDKRQLQNLGLTIKPYWGMWRAILKVHLIRHLPAHYYGIYRRPNM